MVKLSVQLRILACISQKQEKELMLENSLHKEGIVLQTQRLSTGSAVSTACTEKCSIDSSSLKSFTNHRTAMQSSASFPCSLQNAPALSSLEKGRGWRACRGERAAKPLQHRGTREPAVLTAAGEGEWTCCPLVFAPHHLGEAELIHANLRRINLIQLLQFYSAQSAAQLPCEVICYLYTISLEILNSDQMVPCSHKPGFHYLILF